MAQFRIYRIHQLGNQEWFGKIHAESSFDSLLSLTRVCVTRQCDNRNMGSYRITANDFQYLEAVDVWQIYIHNAVNFSKKLENLQN